MFSGKWGGDRSLEILAPNSRKLRRKLLGKDTRESDAPEGDWLNRVDVLVQVKGSFLKDIVFTWKYFLASQ